MNDRNVTTTQGNRLQNQPTGKPASLKDQINSMLPAVQKALASKEIAERFVRHITTTVQINPKLLECTPESFFGSMMIAATLNLMPNIANECWFIPYNNKGKMECQFQIGYKGYMKMFYRSNLAAGCWHGLVFEGTKETDLLDYVKNRLGKSPSPEKKVIGYYAAYELKSGFVDFIYLTIAGVNTYRNKSMAPNSPAWRDNYDEMAFKTCYRHLMKYAPLETDFVAASMLDEKVRNYDKEIMSEAQDILQMPDLVTYEPEEAKPEPDQTPAISKELEQALNDVNKTINQVILEDSELEKYQARRDSAYRNGDLTALENIVKELRG